jgi:hypothetical protein
MTKAINAQNEPAMPGLGSHQDRPGRGRTGIEPAKRESCDNGAR